LTLHPLASDVTRYWRKDRP